MYIAVVPNRNSPPAVLLRESFREDGKIKNRTIANLSRWSAERVAALRATLRGDFDQAAMSGPTQMGKVFGLLSVLKQVADQLGISAALGTQELGKLGLFLVLARIAHQGSRLSAVRWAEDHAVEEVLGLQAFSEDDLYEALDDLCARQEKIEQALYRRYLRDHNQPPRLFLYDVTSSYLEGEKNELGDYGYDRDGKRGKMQIVIGLLTDGEGEPLSVRVFSGNTADPSTVAEQIRLLQEQFQVEELIFVGDRGMVKSKGKQELEKHGLHYITALTDPQIRRLLGEGVLQLELFSEQICEVEQEGIRYLLRKNEDTEARQKHRLEDKLARLERLIETRNTEVEQHPRCKPEAGLRKVEKWAVRHKVNGLVQIALEGDKLSMERKQEAIQHSLELAGCYVLTSNVPPASLDTQQVHDGYMALEKVERDFRTIKTGLLDVRPIYVRKEERTRGHVFCCMLALKLTREIEKRLRAAFATTDTNPKAIPLPDALASMARLCLLHYTVDQKTTVTKLPLPDSRQQQILSALKVKLPAM
jgi:transposase